MSETGISVVMSVITAFSAAFSSGPFGTTDIPDVNLSEKLKQSRPAWAVTVKDQTLGNVEFLSGEKTGLPLSSYPQNFLNAVLAAEDGRFQSHEGADPIGLLSALKDTMNGNVRGGSSITQQLIKNAVVGNEQTLDRKVSEIILAVRAETLLSKTEILESYLNHAWFGRGANGAAHASRVWFGKPWDEVSLAEAATLAAMLKGPSRFDPSKNPDLVKARRDLVIGKMVDYGWVTEAEADEARAQDIKTIAPPKQYRKSETWILSSLRTGVDDFMRRRGESGRVSVLTSTISKDWQAIGEEFIKNAELPEGVEAALVIMRIPDGDLLASVGGVDANLSGFDRTFALRQPGSLGKPLFYGAALDLGMTPWDLVRNDPIDWGGRWSPKNYDGSVTGPAPMYQGLEASSNLMTVHLAEHVRMEDMFRIAEQSGAWSFGGIQPYGPSLLGASETTLRQITSGLAGIANEGRTVPLRTFYEDAPDPVTFISPSSADYVLSMMRGVMVRGTASQTGKQFKVDMAGKTGTSQDHRDAWFVGLTPHVAIGVWVGRDNNKPIGDGATGGFVSARIARNVMNTALSKGLIDEKGLIPGEFIASHADWPPELISPESGEFYASRSEDTNNVRTQQERPGDDQVNAFMQQLDNTFWSVESVP